MGKKKVKGPSVWGAIDVAALLEGTQGIKPGVLRTARREKPMSGHLRPKVAGLPLREQIARLWAAYVIWSHRRSKSDDDRAEVMRVGRIAKIYADLRACGYLLEDVTGFKEKHAEVWLQLLRDRDYSIHSIRSDWGVLRTWCLALSKADMVGKIEKYWPDAPPMERPRKRSAEERHQASHGDARVHAELLRAKDRTHWYVEQLCTSLRLTTDEAVRFSPGLAGDYGAGHISVRCGRGDAVRVIRIANDHQRMLVQEVIEFIFSENRKSLAWPGMRPDDATRKHQQRLTYVRRKLSREHDGDANGPDSSESSVGAAPSIANEVAQ